MPSKPRLPRLPRPGLLGPADDRHADPRDPQSQSSLWGAWRGRNLDRAAAGGDCECGVERDRRSHDPHSDVAAADRGGAGGGAAALMVEVTLWGSLGAVVGGKQKLEVEAKDIRELFRNLAEQYTGFAP